MRSSNNDKFLLQLFIITIIIIIIIIIIILRTFLRNRNLGIRDFILFLTCFLFNIRDGQFSFVIT